MPKNYGCKCTTCQFEYAFEAKTNLVTERMPLTQGNMRTLDTLNAECNSLTFVSFSFARIILK